uniref:Uncharacterized protein n=1 Tax=Anguilla anguilla TaxID=7936 RepID=A0A0E9TPS8_ANGAN
MWTPCLLFVHPCELMSLLR